MESPSEFESSGIFWWQKLLNKKYTLYTVSEVVPTYPPIHMLHWRLDGSQKTLQCENPLKQAHQKSLRGYEV